MLSWCVAITIFYIVWFEAVARALDDVSKNRFKCADAPNKQQFDSPLWCFLVKEKSLDNSKFTVTRGRTNSLNLFLAWVAWRFCRAQYWAAEPQKRARTIGEPRPNLLAVSLPPPWLVCAPDQNRHATQANLFSNVMWGFVFYLINATKPSFLF